MSKTYVALMDNLLKEAEAELERARKKQHNFRQRLNQIEQELIALENVTVQSSMRRKTRQIDKRCKLPADDRSGESQP